jgi:hypothetical protein
MNIVAAFKLSNKIRKGSWASKHWLMKNENETFTLLNEDYSICMNEYNVPPSLWLDEDWEPAEQSVLLTRSEFVDRVAAASRAKMSKHCLVSETESQLQHYIHSAVCEYWGYLYGEKK